MILTRRIYRKFRDTVLNVPDVQGFTPLQ